MLVPPRAKEHRTSGRWCLHLMHSLSQGGLVDAGARGSFFCLLALHGAGPLKTFGQREGYCISWRWRRLWGGGGVWVFPWAKRPSCPAQELR